jgi:hypothetical protein
VKAISATLAIELIRLWAAPAGLDVIENPLEGCGAVMSPCGTYRYLLWRDAGAMAPLMAFAMLNPSTADHRDDDPTIRRCLGWSRAARAGLLVWNLFALRATDPRELARHADPIGPKNDDAIAQALGWSGQTVAAWGTHGTLGRRDHAVLRRCAAQGSQLCALRLTADGHPGHPLYLPKSAEPVVWEYDW